MQLRGIAARCTAAVLLFSWAALTSRGQSFQDLDFEAPTFVPAGSGYQGSVDPDLALPGWTAYWGTTPAPFILHDNEFLDSAGISILDTNGLYGYSLLSQTLEGQYTLLLQGGFSLTSYPNRQSVAVAQTGQIPSWARSMTFLVSGQNFDVSVGGQSRPLINGDSVDVSAFAGQTVEIRFTAFPQPPPGLAINFVYLDDISFSPVSVPEPATIGLLLAAFLLLALCRADRPRFCRRGAR